MSSSFPPIVRSSHAQAFYAFLSHIGAPAACYLGRYGLPTEGNDPLAMVPLLSLWSLFEDASRHECQSLGWEFGAYVGDRPLSPELLRRLESAPTLLAALQDFVKLVRSETSNIDLCIKDRGECILLCSSYGDLKHAPGYDVAQAYQLSVLLDLVRHFLGKAWNPPEMGLQAGTVLPTIPARFEDCRILANRHMGYIAIPKRSLYRSKRSGNSSPSVANHPVPQQSPDFMEALRALLRAYLPDGYPTQQFAASLMDISVSTLSRRLASQGMSYGKLIDELRFQIAIEHLKEPSLRVGEAARAVGFADQADFTRMFRRISGLSPRQFRSEVLHEAQ